MFSGKHAKVALKHRVNKYSMQCTHVSVQITVLVELLIALVTIDPDTLVHGKVVLFNISPLLRLVITFSTGIDWLFFVVPQKVNHQVSFAISLIIALVTYVHIMGCFVFPDSFCALRI